MILTQQPTSPAPAPALDLPRRCSCGAAIEWPSLTYVGMQDDGDGGWLELRTHACGTTLARQA